MTAWDEVDNLAALRVWAQRLDPNHPHHRAKHVYQADCPLCANHFDGTLPDAHSVVLRLLDRIAELETCQPGL